MAVFTAVRPAIQAEEAAGPPRYEGGRFARLARQEISAIIPNMKLNSRESVDTGRKLLKEYGSWTSVREASRRSEGGVFVVRPRDVKQLHAAATKIKAAK